MNTRNRLFFLIYTSYFFQQLKYKTQHIKDLFKVNSISVKKSSKSKLSIKHCKNVSKVLFRENILSTQPGVFKGAGDFGKHGQCICG